MCGASLVAQSVKNHLQCSRPGFNLSFRKTPGEGHGNPLHYSRLEKSMDRGACWVSPWSHKDLDRTEQLTLYDT